MLDDDKKEKISYVIIKTLYSKFNDFPEDASNNRNAPFHTAFLNAFKTKFEGKVSDIPFFISLSSWFHGLNTTLGQTFFEKAAHILSDGLKKEDKTCRISRQQQTAISDIITDLKNNERKPDLAQENELIYRENRPLNKAVPNFTADCYYDDNEKIVAIELKTVKPNSSVFKGEKEKILTAKAGLKNANPNKAIYYYLGFPFDPLSETPYGYYKVRFMNYSVDFKKFFSQEEVLLGEELWSFLSGEKETMKQLIELINTIATPKFIDEYNYINNSENKLTEKEKFLESLKSWNLISEMKLINNEEKIIEKIKDDKRLLRIFNQPILKDGVYNTERFQRLQKLI